MSGICGWAGAGDANPHSPTDLEAMAARLRHRGPDTRRLWLDDAIDVAVAQTHLHSFSPANEPEASLFADDATVVALDGPVFNARDGEHPAAAAARLYAEQPGRYPLDIDGPTATALWDRRTRTLVLSRDPLGEKPLYYHYDAAGNRLLFASEPKSLLAHPSVEPGVDQESLALFLTFGWLPSPRSMIAGISKLAPGERLRWSAERGVETERYWMLPPVNPEPGDRAAFAARARELFLTAVEKYVRGLDEVGLFLSGGMDSTIMLIALKELGVPRIRSFTLGLPGDEKQSRDLDIPYARLVAEKFGAEHQELHFKEPFDPSDLLPGVMSQYDDPILTPNCYTKYLLAAMAARAGVPSVLTGSGAGGGCGPYRRFRDHRLRNRVLKKIRGIEDDGDRFVRLRAKLFDSDEMLRLLSAGTALSSEEVNAYLKPYLDQAVTDDYPRSYLIANLLLTCPEKACAVLDRSGMMASVDVRSPHLDRALVEFQMTMPHSFDGGETHAGIKCLLEDAYVARMPSEVLDRQETGFPSYYWHQGELQSMQTRLFARETLDATGMFDHDEVMRILEEERNDTESKSVGKRSWVLTQLCVWHALHIDRDGRWTEAAAHASPEPLIRATT